MIHEPAKRFVRCPSACLDVVPELPAAAEGLLVGRHHADPVAQERWVAVCDILVAGVVDDNGAPGRSDFFGNVENVIDGEGGSLRGGGNLDPVFLLGGQLRVSGGY